MTVMRYLLLTLLAACVEVPSGVYAVDLTPVASHGPCEGWSDVTLVYDLRGFEPVLVIQNEWECEQVDDLVACTLRLQGDAQRLWVGVNFATETGYLDYDDGYCRTWYDATITPLRDDAVPAGLRVPLDLSSSRASSEGVATPTLADRARESASFGIHDNATRRNQADPAARERGSLDAWLLVARTRNEDTLTTATRRATLAPMALTIKLRRVHGAESIYKSRTGSMEMPERLAYMHPDAADAFDKIKDHVIVSDMLRSAESSLEAIESKKGALPPGYSRHNFGLADDLDVGGSMRKGKFKTKRDLDEFMAAHGFFCHRTDHLREFEEWHFNYLGVGALVQGRLSSDEGEAQVVQMYGHALAPSDAECQVALMKLGMYKGEIDGIIGPRSLAAVGAFSRAWHLSGAMDTRFRRTLAFLASDTEIV